jgi:hypothetical protein
MGHQCEHVRHRINLQFFTDGRGQSFQYPVFQRQQSVQGAVTARAISSVVGSPLYRNTICLAALILSLLLQVKKERQSRSLFCFPAPRTGIPSPRSIENVVLGIHFSDPQMKSRPFETERKSHTGTGNRAVRKENTLRRAVCVGVATMF